MKLLSDIVSLFYPHRCAVCDSVIARDAVICSGCEKYIVRPADKRRRCDICFLPPEKCGCGKRRYYEKLSAPFLSESPALRAVYRLKFNGRLDLIKPFARFMKQALDERELTQKVDIITSVPMRRARKSERGYNQSEELAKALSKETGIEYVPLLTKCQETPPQHSMRSVVERSGNLLGVYEPIHASVGSFVGKTVLVVDDIVTSGSTFNEIAKTLLIFGADRVYGSAVVLVPKKRQKTVK